MKTEKKPFQRVMDSDRAFALCPEGCKVVPMQGYARFEDFYLFVPEQGIFFRSANSARYGDYTQQVFIDGEFIGATPMQKIENVKKLYTAGYVDEAVEYSQGHKLWKETALGGSRINPYKEAARQSHILCDASGQEGHYQRKIIRKQILGLI